MPEETKRSPFAQALYDLMITPGIIEIEEWCFYIDPWVMTESPEGTISSMSEEAIGKSETMALIQSWFDDKALPTGNQLVFILEASQTGPETLYAAVLGGLINVNDPDYRAYVERYKQGGELQTKALDRMYEVLDEFARDVTPLKAEYECPLWVVRLGCLVFEDRFRSLHTFFAAVPLRHRQSVFVRLMEDIRQAEKNNWYETENKVEVSRDGGN